MPYLSKEEQHQTPNFDPTRNWNSMNTSIESAEDFGFRIHGPGSRIQGPGSIGNQKKSGNEGRVDRIDLI